MIAKLNEELRQALHEANDTGPVQVIDPANNARYVLVRAELFEHMQGLLQEFDLREAYPFVDAVLADDDANDPSLASYQDGHPHEPST